MILYNEIERLLNNNVINGMKVLEIGGKKGGYLSSRDDIELIVSNIDKNEGCDVVVDAENIPYENESFDIVFLVACDYFILDINKAHSEFYRVLKNNGILIIASYKEETLKYLQKINKSEYGINSYVYSENDYKSKLKNIGFTVEITHIKNNTPKSFLKKIIWKVMSENEKIKRSPWIVYKCLKKS